MDPFLSELLTINKFLVMVMFFILIIVLLKISSDICSHLHDIAYEIRDAKRDILDTLEGMEKSRKK